MGVAQDTRTRGDAGVTGGVAAARQMARDQPPAGRVRADHLQAGGTGLRAVPTIGGTVSERGGAEDSGEEGEAGDGGAGWERGRGGGEGGGGG